MSLPFPFPFTPSIGMLNTLDGSIIPLGPFPATSTSNPAPATTTTTTIASPDPEPYYSSSGATVNQGYEGSLWD